VKSWTRQALGLSAHVPARGQLYAYARAMPAVVTAFVVALVAVAAASTASIAACMYPMAYRGSRRVLPSPTFAASTAAWISYATVDSDIGVGGE
jgi:hypothetical protein